MVRRFLVIGGLSLMGLSTNAQQKADYPKDYFRNPLNIPILLAGNFGECRPNHFHSGIDIKTKGQENLPVLAAADGYISRIKMERGGFGHALYVTHPNGYTTLYAHLNNFIPAVQKYMKDGQYKNESWEVDFYPDKGQFPVKKGQQIAWSGNTGGSTAPHLHFEIRDSKSEHPLNPQLFGFDIADDIAPKPTEIAIYDLDGSFYEQRPQIMPLRAKGNSYTVADTIRAITSMAGIGINVNDYMNGSTNTLDFYKAEVYVDDVLQNVIALENIGYEETRYLHAYADYPTRKGRGEWIQCMFRLPGNFLEAIYPQLNPNRGAIDLGDGKAHLVRIDITDASGNTSVVSCYLRGSAGTAPATCNGKVFKVNQPNSFEHPNVKFSLGDKAIYDDVCFEFTSAADVSMPSDRYRIHNVSVPVHTYFDLSLKPNQPISFEQRDKVVLMYSDGKDESGKAAAHGDGWYTAKVRNFGTYWLGTDVTPPVLKSLQAPGANLAKAASIRFSATDAVTSVKKFRAELDGKWICFEQKGSVWVYTFDEHCHKGQHELVVTAADENNNTTMLKYTFTR